MHGWEPNTWTGQNVEAEPITVMHPGPWEVPEQEPSTLQSETIHLQQELARVRSDLFRSEQQLEALRVVPHAERQENVADRLLVSKVDYGAEGEGPRELIPIVLGFERLGELLSHLHPQQLQEAAKAAKELPTLRPWPQGQGDLSHCEDPEGLVTKYVEQSVVWAAMIVSRCRSMFVLGHLKQKRLGAVNLCLSLSRARQHRMARSWQRWRRSALLMQRSAQKKQEQLQLWSQGVARTLRLKLLHAQMKHQLLYLFNCWQRQAAQGSRFSQCRSKDGSDNKQRIHGVDHVSRLLNIPASPWQSALSTDGHDSPEHSWESWQSWRKAPRSSESSPRGQRSPPRQLRASKPSLRNLFLLMADGLVASQLHAVLLQWHKGFATRKTAAVALKRVLHKCLEGRRREALSRLRFGTIQRRPVRVSSDKGLQVFLPGRLSVDRSVQAMAVVRPSSEKSVQTLREKNISNNPWCQSWLTRILRRGQRRYLARAWCAWTREYVLRRLDTVLNSRLASRLQSVRWRTMHRYLSAWNTHCLRQHLLRVQQARNGKTQALVRAVCRLTVPGKVALRALLRAWQERIAAKVEALRSIFRSWKLSSFRTRALLGARRFLERRGAEDACRHSYTLFASWKSAARDNSERRACAERSQQSWLASKEELTKLCRRALLERTWARWRHVAAEDFARFRSSRLLEMSGDLQLARQVLLSFQGWKILLFARRSHPARRPSRAMDSFGFVALLVAIVSGWRQLVNRCRHRQLVASNVIRAVAATSSSLLLVSLCRWSRLACQSRQRARASKCQDQLSSKLAALRRNRYLNAGWRGFAMMHGNRKARRAHVFMDPEAVAARRVLLHSATPSDVWLLHQVLQVFCLEVERSRSRKREIVFQMRGKKLAQLVAGAMLPKWEAASRCALLRHAFAVLRQAALQEQQQLAQASMLQFRRELEEERGALRLRQQEDLARRARHRRNSLRPLVLCWRMAAAHRRQATWMHLLMHKVHAGEQGGMVTAIAFFVWRRSSMRLGPRCQRSIMILMNWRQRKAQSKLLTAWRGEAARQRLTSGLCRDFEHTRKSRPTTFLGCLLAVRLWHRVVCEARGGLRMQAALLERSATSQATQQILAVLLQWARLVAESRKRARRRDLAHCQLRLQRNGFLSFLVHAWARMVDREVLANWARACDRSLAAAASASEFYMHKRRTLLIAAIWSGWCFHVSEMRGRCKLLRISQSARNAEHVQLQMILWKHWTTSVLQALRRREELRHRSQRKELQTARRRGSLLSSGFWRWRLRAQRLGLVLRVQSVQAQAFVSLLSPTLCWRLWAELARQRRLSLAQGHLVKRSAARLVTQSIRAVVAARLGQALAQCARHVGLRSQAARFSSRAEELARRHCQRRTLSAWRSAAERTARARLCSRALDVSLQRFGSATVCPGHDRLVGRGCPAVFTARANEALLFHSWRLCARWAAWFDRAWQRSAEVRSDLLLESQQLQDELRRQHSRAERNAEELQHLKGKYQHRQARGNNHDRTMVEPVAVETEPVVAHSKENDAGLVEVLRRRGSIDAELLAVPLGSSRRR
ncbi:unnamed protein product [Symbiodinium sp. CCMP2592]|nr:unnamed protein product [Symbiodinium sp. CCMP2592]